MKISLRTGTGERPNLFHVKRQTKISLSAAVNIGPFFILFIYLFFFFHEQTLPQVEYMTKKKSQFERATKNLQNIYQIQFTTKHFLRSITQIKIYYKCKKQLQNASRCQYGRSRNAGINYKKNTRDKQTENFGQRRRNGI